jgi:hypothetical protein
MRSRSEPRDIDLTQTTWGHNFQVINWGKGDLFVWLTPAPRKGDVLVIQGNRGLIRARVEESKQQLNVDDMYRVRVSPDTTPTTENGETT